MRYNNFVEIEINNSRLSGIILFSSLIVAVSYNIFRSIVNGFWLYIAVILSVTLLGYILVKLLSMIPISLIFFICGGAYAYYNISIINKYIYIESILLSVALVAAIGMLIGMLFAKKKYVAYSDIKDVNYDWASKLEILDMGAEFFGIPTLGLAGILGRFIDEVSKSKEITRRFVKRVSWPVEELIVSTLIGALVGLLLGLINSGNMALRYALISIGSTIGCTIGTAYQSSEHGLDKSPVGAFKTFMRGLLLTAVAMFFVSGFRGVG